MTQHLPPTYPPTPDYAGYAHVPPRKTSGASIVSLVTGLLLCIPVLTSIVAIIFGLIGIRRTKEPNVGGRGLAVAGLILGIVGLLGWSGAGIGIWYFAESSERPREVTRAFVVNLTNDEINAAMRACDPSTINRLQLEQVRDAMKPWGTLRDFKITKIYAQTPGGGTVWEFEGVATFDNATRSFAASLRESGPDQYLITGFHFR